MSEMVDRVAEAIVLATAGKAIVTVSDIAQAALATMRDPTEAMIEAAAVAMYGNAWNVTGDGIKEVWRRYTRAALSGAIEEALK